MNKKRTPVRELMVLTEDVQGGTGEMGSRLGTVWPLPPAMTARVRARCIALEGDLRDLRRALDRLEQAA